MTTTTTYRIVMMPSARRGEYEGPCVDCGEFWGLDEHGSCGCVDPDPCVECGCSTWSGTGLCDACEAKYVRMGIDLGDL